MDNSTIAVVMCTWKRIERLQETLNLLENQTYKNFHLFLWNNNSAIQAQINSIIDKSVLSYPIYTHHNGINIGGIGRFEMVNIFCSDYKRCVFIDDDQFFKSNFLEVMNGFYKPKTIVSWWGWGIKGVDYFSRNRIINLQEADYCGTGGMITDCALFKEDLIRTPPIEYKFVEDLWMSYVAKYEFGYKLLGCEAPIKIIVDNKDQYVGLKNEKQQLLNYLNKKYKNGSQKF